DFDFYFFNNRAYGAAFAPGQIWVQKPASPHPREFARHMAFVFGCVGCANTVLADFTRDSRARGICVFRIWQKSYDFESVGIDYYYSSSAMANNRNIFHLFSYPAYLYDYGLSLQIGGKLRRQTKTQRRVQNLFRLFMAVFGGLC